MACATGTLSSLPALQWLDDSAVTVVMASEGYPEAPVAGAVISGEVTAKSVSVNVYHAGTSRDSAGEFVVSGGRVLSVTAIGADLAQARTHAYGIVETIEFAGEHHRSDIALKAAKGEIHVP